MHPREQAEELLRFAGNRGVHHPVFEAVTEGRFRAQELARAKNPRVVPYSSCGDLAHWLLYRMGLRLRWVNREENGTYQIGRNVNRLTATEFFGSNPVARRAEKGDRYQAGDILVIGAKTPLAHVIVVIGHEPETGKLTTCEYGQPHGAIKERRIDWAHRRIGHRTLDSFLPLDEALNLGATEEKLEEPETVYAYCLRTGLE